jgi:hypothetical protein
MGLLDRLREATGFAVVTTDDLALHEATVTELRATRRDLDMIGYTALDYLTRTGQPDAPIATRRQWAHAARDVWRTDPMAGAAVDLQNDFTFARGVPRPRARDPEVQVVIDEAWDDVDNKAALTTYAAQMALGTDLSLQSNLFLTIFDQGDDGKVKVSVMPHDRVVDVVRDKDNPMRILYYVVEKADAEWDFKNDMLKTAGGTSGGRGGVTNERDQQSNLRMGQKVVYYEHWLNPRVLREEGIAFDSPPAEKLAEGRIYHVAQNRMSEMAFGVPTMQRTLRWLSGYNEVVAARVDMAKAAAAYIMKQTAKATPGQLSKLASQAISRRSELGAATIPDTGAAKIPPANASILLENDAVNSAPFKLDSGSANAIQDTQMIRAQVSAAVGWPQHYLGDASASTVAGNTALELPVLKHVEARQELFENLYRAFIDRVIERAVEVGRLDKFAAPEGSALAAIEPEAETTTTTTTATQEAADDQDETQTERDLSYEFKMPSALRRMMADLVSAVTNTARTFDPNNTNLELSRTLLTITLGEAFEMQDPAEAVERILPVGYQDPAVVAAQAAAQGAPPEQPPSDQQQQNSQGEGAPTGGDGVDQATNPYGAPMKQPPPEQRVVQQSALSMLEAELLADPAFRDAWIAAVELVTED